MSDRPLEGVEIVLTGIGRSVFTNAVGDFRVDSVRPGTHALLARRPGFTPSTMSVTVRDSTVARVTIYLTSSPYMLEDLVVRGTRRGLYGVVADSAWRPVPGARVAVRGGGRTAHTDTLGRFAFPGVKPGSYVVTVTGGGYVPRQFHVTVPGRGSKELAVRLTTAPAGFRSPRGWDWALHDLGLRLAFTPSRLRMTGEELRRFSGMKLCDIPRIRGTLKDDAPPGVIINGTEVLRYWPLCDWNADDLELVEWGKGCSDLTGAVQRLLGSDCDGTPEFARRGRPYGLWVMLWLRQ